MGFVPGDENWDDQFNSFIFGREDYITSIAIVNGNEIYIGANAPTQHRFMKWHDVGWKSLGDLRRWPEGTVGKVLELAILGNDLYLGGEFTKVDTFQANCLVKWNMTTQSFSAFVKGNKNGVENLSNTGSYALINTIAIYGQNLYIGGRFTHVVGIRANNIAKWNAATHKWTPLGKGVNGIVNTIAVSGKEVYAGGFFTSAGGVQVNEIAKWNGTEWSDLGGGTDTDPDGGIQAIELHNGEVYAGGLFSEIGGIKANNIAKWDAQSQHWSPLGEGNNNGTDKFVNGTAPVVYAIAANDRFVYVGGSFAKAGGDTVYSIAKWDPEMKKWSNLGSGTGPIVYDIAVRGQDVHVGGFFSFAGGKPSNRFAIWHELAKHSPSWSPLPSLTFREDGRVRLELLKYVSDVDDSLSALSFKAEVLGKQAAGGQWQETSALQVTINRTTKIANFKASPDSFGVFKVAFTVTDPGQLVDTDTIQVRVKPINDAPQISGLPDSLFFLNNASAELALWDFVSDVETANAQLNYIFAASNEALQSNFNPNIGALVLTAPNFQGHVNLFITVHDDSNAVARDTINVKVDFNTGVAENRNQIPQDFVLLQNHPNPFNPTTIIRFGLPQAAEVQLEVYDSFGRRVATLLHERKEAGYHEMQFDGGSLSSGIYFYRLAAVGFSEMKKLLLVK